jgi:hypothetical protein
MGVRHLLWLIYAWIYIGNVVLGMNVDFCIDGHFFLIRR